MSRKIKITTPSGRSGILTVPDTATDDQIRQIAQSIEQNGISATKETPPQNGAGGKILNAVGTAGQVGLEAVAAPFEMVGEAIRVPVEQRGGYRAPSIAQRVFPSLKTEEPPSIGFDVVNKLLRAGAAFGSRLPQGVDAAQEAALQAYQADRGVLGTAEDVALSVLAGKIPVPGAGVSVAEAPFTGAMKTTSALSKGAGKVIKGVGKGAIRVGLGPTAEQQSTLFRRPSAVKGAREYDELADEMANTANFLAEKARKLDDLAWDQLLKLKAEPRSRILNALKKARAEFAGKGKVGDADKRAVAQIDKYIERVKQIRQPGTDQKLDQMLDQRQLRDIVQSIRKDATYGVPEAEPVNRAVQAAGRNIDKILKENGNYASVMEELQPTTRTLKETVKRFNLTRDPEIGYVSTDATASKISGLSKTKVRKKPMTKRIIENIKIETGKDYIDEANLTETRKAFEPGSRAQGSRRTLLGTVLGSVAEPFIPGFGAGPVIGAATGAAADIYGGSAAGKLIDILRSVNQARQRTAQTIPSSPGVSATMNLIQQLISKGRAAPITAASR